MVVHDRVSLFSLKLLLPISTPWWRETLRAQEHKTMFEPVLELGQLDLELSALIMRQQHLQWTVSGLKWHHRPGFYRPQLLLAMNKIVTAVNNNYVVTVSYDSECSRVIKSDMYGLSPSTTGVFRKICRIFWPNKISNRELYRKTCCQSVVMEIKRRRIRWLCYVLGIKQSRIIFGHK